jgi:hypothetical protein
MKNGMNYKDLFELESALSRGCNSKHWQLIKPVGKMLAIVREETTPYKDKLQPTPAMRAYKKALDRIQTETAGEDQKVINEKIRNLIAEHKQAITDTNDLHQLDVEMSRDEVAPEFVARLVPIPESLLHDAGVLRIDPSAYLVLDRLGLIADKKE